MSLKTKPPESTRPLTELQAACQQERDAYTRRQRKDSSCCLEIVRRAARGNANALSILLHEITPPLIARVYKKKYRTAPFTLNDLQQAVLERLIEKFNNKSSPYRATTFAAYCSYVITTTRRMAVNWLTRGHYLREHPISTGILKTPGGQRPEQEVQKSEQQRIALQTINLAHDSLTREVLRLRFGYEESYAGILQMLQARYPELTRKKLYRIVEKGLWQIRNHPDFQRIREDYQQ